ncbi:MAG: flagellar protein [Clostridiales bacterium]|jgi:flagellar operon protein|nr:flagellar protein [Clostridiales bacterium]
MDAMDNTFLLNRLSVPIVTGVPVEPNVNKNEAINSNDEKNSFKKILQEQISNASGVNFSSHAVNRVLERNINISESNLARLNDGVRIAEEKGLNEPLILIDSAAYIVNIKNNTVITTVANDDLKGSVFTNIDGTVII